MRFYFLFLWCTLLNFILSAQIDVEYFDNPNRVFHLNQIDGKLYFVSYNVLLDIHTGPNESLVYSFDNSSTQLELVLNQINDSLDHVYLFNIYERDENLLVFCLSLNNQTGKRYLTNLIYDSNFENLIDIELFPIEKMRSTWGYQFVSMGNKIIWYFLEFDKMSRQGKSLVRVTFKNGQTHWTRSLFDDGITYTRIYDVYLEEDKEILILNSSDNYRKFLCYDNELNLLYSGFQNTLYQGASRKNPQTWILGGQEGNYNILERFPSRDGPILVMRDLVFNSDTTWISDDYTYLFPEDNSHLVLKNQQQDYTIVQYSNSSLEIPSDSYGFRIMYFNKHGALDRDFEVKEESAMVLDRLNFYENNTVAYGNGNWISPEFIFDPFIIKLTFSDSTTSTEDLWQEAAPPLLKSNLIIDGQLSFNESEIDLQRITIYDINGRLLISGLGVNGDISSLPSGHYFLRYNGLDRVQTERFVKVE